VMAQECNPSNPSTGEAKAKGLPNSSQLLFYLKKKSAGHPLTHTCNPTYSGGRDQEDRSSKPTWASSSQDPISKKKKITKKDLWSDSRCRPWDKTSALGKKKTLPAMMWWSLLLTQVSLFIATGSQPSFL
jgi:hypothetical protein